MSCGPKLVLARPPPPPASRCNEDVNVLWPQACLVKQPLYGPADGQAAFVSGGVQVRHGALSVVPYLDRGYVRGWGVCHGNPSVKGRADGRIN